MTEPRLDDDIALGIESDDCLHGVDAITCKMCDVDVEAVQIQYENWLKALDRKTK